MQFEFTDPQTEFERAIGGSFSINALGTIQAGDGIKFREFVNRSAPPPRTTVYIDSSGGNVEEAMLIGRTIRDCWFSTSIGKYLLNTNKISDISHIMVPRMWLPGRCMSAATPIFLGGRLRYFPQGSEFGVHQFSFKTRHQTTLVSHKYYRRRLPVFWLTWEYPPTSLNSHLRFEATQYSSQTKTI